ncbi:MAG: hypothetical protein KC415_17525 [Anaerolineales bacterium]|nr:hypothetical protein [Anaerolineales bacterium]MCB9003496.1 hypothetical protein [Ardenticatenaceae bacterium]
MIAEIKGLPMAANHTLELQNLGFITSGIVHDLNNILTSILGEAGLALRNLPPDSAAHVNVEQVEKAAKYAARLTNSLMAYVNGKEVQNNAIDLNAIIVDIASLIDSTFPKVTFNLDLANLLPWVKAKEVHLQQIGMNLLINAAQATNTVGGTVSIQTGEQFIAANTPMAEREELTPGNYIFLRVEDNGSGISENDLQQMFNPFYSTKNNGRGLGLTTIYNILQGYNGHIVVESEPGIGSIFTAYIPCKQ